MSLTCKHCDCDNYREELMGNAMMVSNEGNCKNCQHPVNAHPRSSAAHVQASALSLESFSLAFKNVVDEVKVELIKKIKNIDSPQMYDISSPQMSDAEIAALHMQELRKKMPTFAMPQTEGPPVCYMDDWYGLIEARKTVINSPGSSNEIKTAVSNESYLCWQMTPYLQALFREIGIVVNSEDHKWVHTFLEDHQNFMKPDFFVTLRGLMAKRDSSGHPHIKALRNGTESINYDFGVMLWEIRDCMRVLIEFKNKLSPQHFGKLVIYLQHLSRNSPGCMYYGMLCDDTDIILASCCDSMVCTRYELKWTSPGSQAFVRKFVDPQNSWMQLLSLSMSLLGVELQGDEAFLGMGRNGRVFRVQGENGTLFALKIVLSPDYGSANSVFAEHQILRTLREKALPVVTVVGDRATSVYADGKCLGVCYLMMEVGTPMSRLDLNKVFMLLLALHKENQYHGDPRLANIICVEEKLLWIDFMRIHDNVSEAVMKLNFEKDVRTLTQSVSEKCAVNIDNDAFDNCIRAYVECPSELLMEEILRQLVDA